MNYWKKYADLLVHYSLGLQPGDRALISTTMLAEPLIRCLYESALKAGASVDFQLSFREQDKLLLTYGSDTALEHINPLREKAFKEYEAYLYIYAPYNLNEGTSETMKANKAKRSSAGKALSEIYSVRTGNRSLRRSLCLFPNQAHAQQAGMSLTDYQAFVFNACKLNEPDPIAAWKQLHANQQRYVDYLNNCSKLRYVGDRMDITFGVKGRTWINSDGQTNMPSGEVYTSPLETETNGTAYFPYAFHNGHELEHIQFNFEDGYLVSWQAEKGQDYLDQVFKIEGARRLGEVAIGTNYDIDRWTKVILFDEKMGGTIHMAVGQSYYQCGGQNQSAIHWDLIAPMQDGGEIYGDDELIYKDGRFIID